MPSLGDRLRNRVLSWLSAGIDEGGEQAERYALLRRYERGEHRKQLKVKAGHPDDNIFLNFAGLVVDRTVSMLLGGGVSFTFDYPKQTIVEEGEEVEQASAQEELLDDIWDANKQQILLHKLAYFGAVYGTAYVKLQPEGIESREEPGKMLTRLIALNPQWMTITTDPEDFERVIEYRLQFKYTQTLDNGQTEAIARLETVSREMAEEQIQVVVNTDTGETKPAARMSETGNWVIREFVSSRLTGGKWQQIGEDVIWPYSFPPILHWQNLPDPESCYGISDIEDVLDIQDRTNFVNSNVSKIIRFYASPTRWSRGMTGSSLVEMGPDKIVNLNGSDATLENLEMQSDLSSSRAFALDLRQALFDISRTVDLSSVADKLGSLTNFGLRTLYMDALNKNGTKQELYGDALTELNHRLLVLAGYEGAAADGGEVVWSDPLPVNRTETVAAEVSGVSAGIESKQTAAENMGLDWDVEQERMKEQGVLETSAGEMALTSFERGQNLSSLFTRPAAQ